MASVGPRSVDAGAGARQPVGERVLGELGRRILSGRYQQGVALPTELQLCAEFGVSRTVMREATKMLAAKGLVIARKRAGTLVQESDNWHRLDPDVLSWMDAAPPDPEFIRGLIEARLAIEPAAAMLAAQRATAADLARIETGYLSMCAADLSDLSACASADVEFHVSILKASHNPVFAGLASLIGQALANSFRLTTSVSKNYSNTLHAHGDVLEAIRLREPELARSRMRALIDIASTDLVKATASVRRRNAHAGV